MTLLKILFDAPALDWIRFFLFTAGITAFIGISEKARSALGWSPEVTRKLVHVGTGVLIVFSPLFFTSVKPLLWMAVLFIAVNFAGVPERKTQGHARHHPAELRNRLLSPHFSHSHGALLERIPLGPDRFHDGARILGRGRGRGR